MRRLTQVFTILLAAASVPALAAPVFKCVDANGAISFQATPCPPNTTQTDAVIRNDLATPVAPPAGAGTAISLHSARRPGADMPPVSAGNPSVPVNPPVQTPRAPALVSYECRIPNGEVFYQHQPCPRTASTGVSETVDSVRGVRFDSSNDVPVTSRQISRQEACQKMNSAGAIGREGRDRDQKLSTYDKNRGIDPCK